MNLSKRILSLTAMLFLIFAVTTFSHAALIAYWDFEDGTDKSNNNHNGYTVGNAQYAVDSSGISELGTSLYMPTVGGYFRVEDHSDLDLNTSFTYSLWAKSTGDFSCLIGKYYPNPYYDGGYSIYARYTDGFLGPLVATDVSTYYTYVDAGLQKNVWQHITVVYDNSNVLIYVDGDYKAQFPATGTLTNGSSPLLIGALPQPSSYKYGHAGYIDEVRLYDTALDATEIDSLYNFQYGSTVPEPMSIVLLALSGLALIRKFRK